MTGRELEEVRSALRIPRPLFAKALGYKLNKYKKIVREYGEELIDDIDIVQRILQVVPQMVLNHVEALNEELQKVQRFGVCIEALGPVVAKNIKHEKWKDRFGEDATDEEWNSDEHEHQEDPGETPQAEG